MVYERPLYMREISVDHPRNGVFRGEAKLVGDGCELSLRSINMEMMSALERAYRSRARIKMILELPVSEIDEARRLLGIGQNSAAIAKALDILERLDK